MELLIDAGVMERFLSMRPKVFLAACEAPRELPALTSGAQPLCDLWLVDTTGARDKARLCLTGQAEVKTSNWVRPLQPPATLSIFAAGSPAARDDLEALQRWWKANGPSDAPAIYELKGTGAGIANEILLPILQRALAELQQSAAQQASLAAQLYLLRTEHEQMQAALQALQEQQGRFWQGLQLYASLPPAGAVLTPDRKIRALTQYLPIAAEGLACFDLHFPTTRSGQSGGQLLVELHALDRDQSLGQWRVAVEDIRPGWVRFALPQASTLSAHDLELSLVWHGRCEVRPDISLASVGDWDELQASTEAGVALSGALAVMLWSAAPGTKLRGGVPCGTRLPGQAWEFRLSQRELARAVISSPDNCPRAGFDVLQELPDGGLLLHPTGPYPNVAYIPLGCPAGVRQISATVKINHPEAVGHVQYALVATRHEPVYELAWLADLGTDPRVLAFSGWETVPPDQLPYAVCMSFAEPLAESAHLALATRSYESTVYAWAQWLEFRMQLQPPARVFESEVRNKGTQITAGGVPWRKSA